MLGFGIAQFLEFCLWRFLYNIELKGKPQIFEI